MRTVYSHSSDPGPAEALSESPDSPLARIHAAFRARSTTTRQWALGRGYDPRSVYVAIKSWVGRTDREPHGGQARQIIRLLRQELGTDLVPAPPTARPRRRAAGTPKRAAQ
jgi:hypothetical protein